MTTPQLTDRERDFLQALSGTSKSTLSLIPGLGQAIAGWDAYNRSSFERNLKKIITHLQNKVENLESLLSAEWIKSEEGQQFSRKVFDCAFDTQLEDKQELFINVLINGIIDKGLSYLEKLKFTDILRNLSLPAIMVLADIHKLIQDDHSPSVFNPDTIAETLGSKYDPHLVEASIDELRSQGVFSDVEGYDKGKNGEYHAKSRYGDRLCYTKFTLRLVTFITEKDRN